VRAAPKFYCACWKLDAGQDEIEDLLGGLRKKAPGAVLQVFSSTTAPNPALVSMIAAQTLSAMQSDSLIAERPEVDLLLRLASTRQIGEAFKRIGYKEKGRKLFMAVASQNRSPLVKLEKEVSRDKRFSELPSRRLDGDDLDKVEKAALLSARI